MRVFVTGGTGFTGSRVVPLLVKNGYEVRYLHRRTSDLSTLPQAKIEWVEGELSDYPSFAPAMWGTHVLVNIASLGFGHVDTLLRAAQSAGIQRALFISTTAIFTHLNTKSKEIRLAAERAIQASGLQYTILRPTMIYGGPRDRNMWRLIRYLRIFPLIPIFGDGSSLQEPIYVDDVAQAVLSCLSTDRTIFKSYNIAGKYALTYNEVIETIAKHMHKRIWKLRIPSKPVVGLLKLFEQMGFAFPLKAEQVLRLNENKSFSYEDAQRDFGFAPISFDEGIRRELQVN